LTTPGMSTNVLPGSYFPDRTSPRENKSRAREKNRRNALAAVAMILGLASVTSARAADVSPDSLKVAPGVVKASGYETPPATYIVANGTNIYSDHSFFDSKVTGQLTRGEHVDVLAKVKGWEWVLVGKDGTGIGYVAISMLSPADKYVP
jgi:uncharacterized protein YgiM (DUF1202 family)